MQCDAIMDIDGDHLLHFESVIHRTRRHDAQGRPLYADLIKAAWHSVLEPHPFGHRKQRPDISALGSHGGSDMNITFRHPLSLAQVRDVTENALNLLKKAWDEKVRRFDRVLHDSATAVKLFPMSLSTLGGRHTDLHREMRSIAVNIASRTLNSLEYASQTLFQRHAALLVSNTTVCLILASTSGFEIGIETLCNVYPNEAGVTSKEAASKVLRDLTCDASRNYTHTLSKLVYILGTCRRFRKPGSFPIEINVRDTYCYNPKVVRIRME